MASALVWKVYNDSGEMVAATRHAEDAAAVVGLTNSGKIKVDGRVVWNEGVESQYASESYDYAAGVMYARRRENLSRRIAKLRQAQENYEKGDLMIHYYLTRRRNADQFLPFLICEEHYATLIAADQVKYAVCTKDCGSSASDCWQCEGESDDQA